MIETIRDGKIGRGGRRLAPRTSASPLDAIGVQASHVGLLEQAVAGCDVVPDERQVPVDAVAMRVDVAGFRQCQQRCLLVEREGALQVGTSRGVTI